MRLPPQVADALAGRALDAAIAAQVLPAAPGPDWSRFTDFYARVAEGFVVPETTITPTMARLLFGIATVARPRRCLFLGSYVGNAMIWVAGPVLDEGAGGTPRCLGLDVDASAVDRARLNFASLFTSGWEFEVADVLQADLADDEPWDLVLIDVDDPVLRKSTYTRALEACLPSLRPGALVLAHDIAVPRFKDELRPYLDRVHGDEFAASVGLEIDDCGLEVSRLA